MADKEKLRAEEGVAGAGFALVLVVFLVIAFVVGYGLHVLNRAIGGALGALGPATRCGARIATRQQSLVAGGAEKCAAYAQAVDEAAGAPGSGCPAPSSTPPASGGVYAEFLRDLGCPAEKKAGGGAFLRARV